MAYVEVSAKEFLGEFTTTLGLGAPVVSWRPGPEGMVVVGVQVDLGPGDSVPFLRHEAIGAAVPEAEQTASLMVIYALATERQVQIRDINFHVMEYQQKQNQELRQKLTETQHLCVELMDIVRSSESEVAFLERLSHRFYRRIRGLKDTIAAMQQGDGSFGGSS
ncbi:unnamed protein product [Alopecurus aequalis]